MPEEAQGAKYTLGETKLPRAAWVSPSPNPFFLMRLVSRGVGLGGGTTTGVCLRRDMGDSEASVSL